LIQGGSWAFSIDATYGRLLFKAGLGISDPCQ
jgi:hypothetical protein